jgi:hypothetical protein
MPSSSIRSWLRHWSSWYYFMCHPIGICDEQKSSETERTGTSFLSTGPGKTGRGTTLSSQGSGRAPAADSDFPTAPCPCPLAQQVCSLLTASNIRRCSTLCLRQVDTSAAAHQTCPANKPVGAGILCPTSLTRIPHQDDERQVVRVGGGRDAVGGSGDQAVRSSMPYLRRAAAGAVSGGGSRQLARPLQRAAPTFSMLQPSLPMTTRLPSSLSRRSRVFVITHQSAWYGVPCKDSRRRRRHCVEASRWRGQRRRIVRERVWGIFPPRCVWLDFSFTGIPSCWRCSVLWGELRVPAAPWVWGCSGRGWRDWRDRHTRHGDGATASTFQELDGTNKKTFRHRWDESVLLVGRKRILRTRTNPIAILLVEINKKIIILCMLIRVYHK